MVPEKYHYEGDKRVVDRPAFGVASEITADGELKEVWRTEGWYAFECYLSKDGRYLVRMGLWASDREHHTDLAVAFYDRGKLLKQYQVKELIRRDSMIEYSVSHYQWRPSQQTKPTGLTNISGKEAFHLVTIDKTVYVFELGTGKIIATDEDKAALSDLEVWRMAKDAAAVDGERLLQESGRKEEFETVFQLRDVNSPKQAKTYGVHFEERQWGADFSPKKPMKVRAEIEGYFKVTNAGKLVFGLGADALMEALKVIVAHPYVEGRFARHDAEGVRLRVSGDRLHWHTDELIELLKAAKMKDNDLNSWAYVIVDEPQHSFHSLYLNIHSGEIVREDTTTWPYGVQHIDKEGHELKR